MLFHKVNGSNKIKQPKIALAKFNKLNRSNKIKKPKIALAKTAVTK